MPNPFTVPFGALNWDALKALLVKGRSSAAQAGNEMLDRVAALNHMTPDQFRQLSAADRARYVARAALGDVQNKDSQFNYQVAKQLSDAASGVAGTAGQVVDAYQALQDKAPNTGAATPGVLGSDRGLATDPTADLWAKRQALMAKLKGANPQNAQQVQAVIDQAHQQALNGAGGKAQQWAAKASKPLEDLTEGARKNGLQQLIEPQTPVGTGIQTANQLAETYLLGGLAGAGAGSAPSGLARAGALFGGKGYLEAKGTALTAGMPTKKAEDYADAKGLVDAVMAVLPLSKTGEALGGKLAIGASPAVKAMVGKVFAGLTEAEGMTILNNMANRSINPKTGVLDQDSLLQNIASVAGLKALAAPGQGALEPGQYKLPQFSPGGRTTFRGEGKTAQSVEDSLYNLRNQDLADKALGVAYVNKLRSTYGPEVSEELYHNLEAKTAGLDPKPLSPAAQKASQDPAWIHLNEALGNAYAANGGQATPDYVHRVVTAGVEPGGPNAGAPIKTGDQSLNPRTMMAAVTPGGRQIVNTEKLPEGVDPKSLVQATTPEIEAAFPEMQYRKDAFQNNIEALLGQRRAQRGREFLDMFNGTDLVKPMQPTDTAPPQGFEAGTGQFEGKWIDKRISPVFDRLQAHPSDPSFVDKAEAALTGVGFINPVVHPQNMGPHYLGAKGLSGLWDLLKGSVGFKSDSMDSLDRAKAAVDSIHAGQPNQDAIDLLNAGTNFMSIKGQPTKAWDAIQNEDPGVNRQAMLVRNGGEQGADTGEGLLGPVNEMNKNITWKMDDTLRAALTLDYARENGVSLPDATREVNRSYVNYRRYRNLLEAQPGNEGIAGGLNETMDAMANSPVGRRLLRFQAYNQGKWRILGTKLQDLVYPEASGDIASPEHADERQFNAASKIAATAASSYALSKLLGGAYRGLTQDDQGKVSIGGTAHPAEQLYHILQNPTGQKEWTNFVLGNATPSAVPAFAYGATQGFVHSSPSDTENPGAPGALTNIAGNMAKGGLGGALFASGPVGEAIQGTKQPENVLMSMLLRGRTDKSPAEEAADAYGRKNIPAFLPDRFEAVDLGAKKLARAEAKSDDMDSISGQFERGEISAKDFEDALSRSGASRADQLGFKVKALRNYADAIDVLQKATPEEKLVIEPIVLQKWGKGFGSDLQAGTPGKIEHADEATKKLFPETQAPTNALPNPPWSKSGGGLPNPPWSKSANPGLPNPPWSKSANPGLPNPPWSKSANPPAVHALPAEESDTSEEEPPPPPWSR